MFNFQRVQLGFSLFLTLILFYLEFWAVISKKEWLEWASFILVPFNFFFILLNSFHLSSGHTKATLGKKIWSAREGALRVIIRKVNLVLD